MTTERGSLRWWVGAAAIAGVGWLVLGGDLEPPGPPASTMKTLQEVEPRTPVQGLPAGSALHTISEPGSYYLTADVVVAAATQSGIFIGSDDVTLDLNGYSVRHTGNSQPTSRGIWTTAPAGHDNVTILNGRIDGFGGGGLWMQSTRAFLHDLRISNNNVGVSVGPGSVIRDCTAYDNVASGYAVAGPAVIDSSTARNNGDNGLILSGGPGSTITRCVSEGNATEGIEILLGVDGARVEGNHVVGNGGAGIVSSGMGTVIVRNTVGGNAAVDIATGPDNLVGTLVTSEAAMNAAPNDLVNVVLY